MARSIRFEWSLLPCVVLALAACEKKKDTPPMDSAIPSTAPAESVMAASQAAAASAAARAAEASASAARATAASASAVASAGPPPDRTPPKDAIKTKSGLSMLVLTKGTGKKHPKATDSVRAQFRGYGPNGRAFGGGEPALLDMSHEPPGWVEALEQMVEGEKRRVWMPAALAYGNAPGAPADDLVLDLELMAIPEAPKAPADLKAPPKDATKLPDGLVYKILQKGSGKDHPTATSRVTMHYTGWSKDGKMFDSSVMRGTPLTIGLNQVIPGWTESVPLMVTGDKMRVWIPAALAYGEKPARPGAPAGDLVFDMELVSFK